MIKKLIGKTVLRLSGWSEGSGPPEEEKFVLVAAPHTSNWDFPLMMAYAFAYDVDISWLGKHTLFKPPFGWIFQKLGGVSVDRRSRHNVVEQLAKEFENHDRLIITVSPEGSRGRRDFWKSGFYEIARAAKVPVVLSILDYGRKHGGFGPAIELTGDRKADMDKIRAFYAEVTACEPENFGPIRLKNEESSSDEQAG
jgi:1-acyl-sn-glycerol-3-phosphate acyltransferase